MSIGQVKKWGNSLAIRLPKDIVAKLDIADGMDILIKFDPKKGEVILVPQKKAKLTLDDLVRRITKENIHPETDWGKPRGNEYW